MSTSFHIKRRGFMLVLSSPSGAGKTAISRRILEDEAEMSLSISVTTRPPRPGEINGKDYFFVDVPTFEGMVQRNEFLEHARFCGNYYGTPREPVRKALEEGKDILFDIDWQGTQQIAENAREDLVSVFVLPPSIEELERRLFSRGQDSEEVVRRRMSIAAAEMSHWNEYDYVIVNIDFEESVRNVRSIIQAERLKRGRQIGLASFVNGMRSAEESK
ncbi:MAG: guanylate kinase [Alphaproteobacteria bacterium]